MLVHAYTSIQSLHKAVYSNYPLEKSSVDVLLYIWLKIEMLRWIIYTSSATTYDNVRENLLTSLTVNNLLRHMKCYHNVWIRTIAVVAVATFLSNFSRFIYSIHLLYSFVYDIWGFMLAWRWNSTEREMYV